MEYMDAGSVRDIMKKVKEKEISVEEPILGKIACAVSFGAGPWGCVLSKPRC